MSALSAAASDKDGDTIKALRARVASLEALLRGEPGFYITMPRAVVEQALEALFMYKPMVTGVTFQHGLYAMQALRAALEQPRVEQSSVVGVIGWKNHLPNSGTVVHWTALMPPLGTKLYIHPQPKRKPLTDEWIAEVLIDETNGRSTGIGFKTLRAFARAIERAHGITGEQA